MIRVALFLQRTQHFKSSEFVLRFPIIYNFSVLSLLEILWTEKNYENLAPLRRVLPGRIILVIYRNENQSGKFLALIKI